MVDHTDTGYFGSRPTAGLDRRYSQPRLTGDALRLGRLGGNRSGILDGFIGLLPGAARLRLQRARGPFRLLRISSCLLQPELPRAGYSS